MELQECIVFQLAGAQNAVNNFFRDQLSVYDITPEQYALLKCLWQEDMQTPTQLAQTLRLYTSSITGILSQLEDKKLLERVYSQQDQRSIQIHLLEDGVALQQPIEAMIRMANENIVNGISQEEYIIFTKILQIMQDNAKIQ